MVKGGKTKVLHVFGNYLAPSQIWAYHLLKNFTSVEVHIAALHFLKYNFYDTSFHFIPNEFDAINLYKKELNGRQLLQCFQRLIIRSLPYLLKSYDKKIVDYILQNDIQLLHAHFGPIAWQYRKVAQQARIPLLVSFYGYDYEYYPRLNPAFKKHYQELFQMATLFFCEGSHGREILMEQGCPSEKIQIAPLGIEMDNIGFKIRNKKPGQLNLIQVASFAEKKGHIYTLKAFKQALNICPNIKLTLIGNAKEKEVKREVDNFIRVNNLSDYIKLHEFLPYAEIIEQLYQHHVFIHPSCYTTQLDCEGGAPIVLLDAQASGMPIISTVHCDIPEEVIHQKTGWLVEERDVNALSNAIRYFYQMESHDFEDFSRNARDFVEEKFDVKKNVTVLETSYRAISSISD